MDTGLSDLEQRRKQEIINALGSELPEQKKLRLMAYQLKLKRPGVKQLMGESPLNNEEFAELEKYFKMSRRSV